MTTILATLFFLTSLALFYIAANREGANTGSVTDIEVPAAEGAASESDVPSSGAGDDGATGSDSEEVIPAPAE